MPNRKIDKTELNQLIHVWDGSFCKNEYRISDFEKVLAKDEKVRANRFKFKKDKSSYIISRGILRLLLGNYLNENPAEIRFEYTSFGKPYLPKSDLYFNISHSGDKVALAFFLGSEIGIDIEKIKSDFDLLEIAQNFFSKTEIESLEKQPKEELPRAFFRCWTRKESFIKAEGSGLSFPLDQFAVSLDNDESADLLETKWDIDEKDNWSLFSFVPDKNYIVAVAVRHEVVDIQYYNWDS